MANNGITIAYLLRYLTCAYFCAEVMSATYYPHYKKDSQLSYHQPILNNFIDYNNRRTLTNDLKNQQPMISQADINALQYYNEMGKMILKTYFNMIDTVVNPYLTKLYENILQNQNGLQPSFVPKEHNGAIDVSTIGIRRLPVKDKQSNHDDSVEIGPRTYWDTEDTVGPRTFWPEISAVMEEKRELITKEKIETKST